MNQLIWTVTFKTDDEYPTPTYVQSGSADFMMGFIAGVCSDSKWSIQSVTWGE